MRTRLTLKPGQNGTKRLTEEYGDRLVCVRDRYDPATGRRILKCWPESIERERDLMQRFVLAVRASLENENWYSAIFVALSLPDICGKLQSPDKFSGERYKDWFQKYMGHHYAHEIGPDHQLHVFLSPNDCYALRCAFLHEGEDELGSQRAREVLERIHFVVPTPGMMMHCNQFNNILQIQVDIFCRQICEGVEAWIQDTAGDADIQTRMNSLARLYTARDQII